MYKYKMNNFYEECPNWIMRIICQYADNMMRIEIDHFHNAASFVEMPQKVVENYVKYIQNFP